MKNLIVSSILLITNFANADLYTVKAKFCNKKSVAVQKGERVFIDLSKLILGVGFTDNNNCRVVDFKSIVIQSKNDDTSVLVPVNSIGRRSSCASDISQYAGPEFTIATIKSNSLELDGVDGECSNIFFQY